MWLTMSPRNVSLLSIFVCSTIVAGCDDPLAVTPAQDNHEQSSAPAAPVIDEQENAQKPVEQETPVAPQENLGKDEPATEPATEQANEDKVPEGAEPIPETDPVEVEPLVPDAEVNHIPVFAIKADEKDAGKMTPVGVPTGEPNIGAFVPRAKAMWLRIKPGTDMAQLELGVPVQDLRFLPGKGDEKVLMVDVTGKGNFKEMKLMPVDKVKAPLHAVKQRAGKLRFFSTEMPIDRKRMATMLTEYNNRKHREVVEFRPGTPEVLARHRAHRIDVEGFLAGQKVDLSLVSQMSPLGTLGALPVRIDRNRSLMIRDLRVIEDPRRTVNPCDRAKDENMHKIWGFGHLMQEMAKQSGVSTQAFVESWLATWSKDQAIHSKDGLLLDEISDHAGWALEHKVIRKWRKRSGGKHLDLRIAPFRLLAIIYRPDLAKRSPLLKPSQNNPGELRFVFGMMETTDLNRDGDSHDWFETCRSIEASVILEYDIPATGCERTKSWANEMIHLSKLGLGTEKYNENLARLSRFVVRSGAAPDRPNKSALGQLRTNEIALSTAWQMREFHIDQDSGLLKQTTVEDTFRHHGRLFSKTRNTPHPKSLRGSHIMFEEIEQNMSMILDGRYTMPEINAHGQPLLSGGVTLLGSFGRYDDHKLRSHEQRQARFNIGVNTCDGCHTAETGTQFYHIFPNRPGKPTRFSSYLQNSPHKTTHLNAQLKLERHEFDETKTRVQALQGMANQVCSSKGMVPLQLTEAPLKRVH